MESGRGWLAGDWPSTGGVLNITAAAWTAGFHWWRSGNITRTQNVSEYMLVLALCLVKSSEERPVSAQAAFASFEQVSLSIRSTSDTSIQTHWL